MHGKIRNKEGSLRLSAPCHQHSGNVEHMDAPHGEDFSPESNLQFIFGLCRQTAFIRAPVAKLFYDCFSSTFGLMR